MQLSPQVIQQFNTPDTVLVISKYPYKDIAASYHGVAHYTQRTLTAIAKKTGKRFVVLVQHEYDREVQYDAAKHILVVPCFSDGVEMFGQLLRAVRQFNHCSLIHIHSEFYTTGNVLQMGCVIPFLWTLKALGKDVRFIAHNVVTDLGFLARHLGKSQNDVLLKVAELFIPLYYKLLSFGLTHIVALDESIRQKLQTFFSDEKIYLSPLWITPKRPRLKLQEQLKKQLNIASGDAVLLCFGFMTRYKGVDWLVKAVHHLNAIQKKRVHLVLAGGKAPSQAGKKHYELFYNELSRHAAANPYIHLTGFLPEHEIAEYFGLADLVVLPYRGIIGASASWAEAMKYGKPFILSTDLQPYLESDDMQLALSEAGLGSEDILFGRNVQTFAKKVMSTLDSQMLARLEKVSRRVATERSPRKQISRELMSFYTPQSTWKFVRVIADRFSLPRLGLSRLFSAVR